MSDRRPGPEPLTEKREEFFRLYGAGVSSARAARLVGVNPRTAKRWRLGRTITSSNGRRLHYPPVVLSGARVISSRFLSEGERVRIADLHRAGRGVRAIAAELGRSASTISRELRRNLDAASGQYRSFEAHWLAAVRRRREGRGKLLADEVLCGFVQERLDRRWSPEQIAAALRVEFPGQRGRHLAVETIYATIYRRDGALRRERSLLRTGRWRRLSHRAGDVRRAGSLTDMTMIDARPAEAADRKVAGHWEGDCIIGATRPRRSGRWWSARPGSRSCCTCPTGDARPRR